MKFKIWNRELDFDPEKQVIKYKDKIFTPAIRTYGDMEKLYESKLDLDKNTWLYFMFRDVFFEDNDKKILDKNNIRYDITILSPQMFWEEYNKTYGHYHPKNKEGNDYREIYQILSWNAIYLQQNKNEIFYTKAQIWDQVVMETWFGHVTINPSDTEYLIMANYVEGWWNSIYNEYRDFSWANYLYKTNWFELNKLYNNSIELLEKNDIFWVSSMYDDFFENPKKFDFLH